MIAVRLEGRMGNQLFQYAFAYSAARKLGCRFYFDKSVEKILIDEYFEIGNDFCHGIDRKVFSIEGYKIFFSYYCRKAFYFMLRKLFFLKDEYFSSDLPASVLLPKIRNRRRFIGFFQSEPFFEDYKTEIRNLFSIKPAYKKHFERIKTKLPAAGKYVTMHVRRGDYASLDLGVPEAYYHQAIKSIDSEDNFYIIISDDPKYAGAEFAYLKNKYVSADSEIVDFQLMMCADICILSGSTFSWWGAWLNDKKDKKVIAPALWLGKKMGKTYPEGILQPDWTLIYDE